MDDWSGGSRCFSAPGTRASYCFRWIPYARDAQRCEFAVGLRDKHWSGWLWALAGRSPPERKPVQPATARPHTPRYRQNPRNLALGWCLIRSFWLNQLTLCWRGLDSNFQYARELAPGRRRKKAGAIKARRSTSRGAIAAISAVIIPLIDVRALRPVSLWLAVIRKEQLLAFDFVAGDLGLTRRRGEPVAERHAHICPYLMKLSR